MSNWHARHREKQTLGDKIADRLAKSMGSWNFLILQTIFVFVWIAANIIGFLLEWDPYPFILLNLIFSTQAAYAAPIIMMAQNRQAERDRYQAEDDYETNKKAKEEIEELQSRLARIETEKLDKILRILEKQP